MRPYTKYEGLHWTTWLPLRGVRRHMWIQWVWGNVRWCGCSPPWQRCKVLCPLWSKWHTGTTHARPAQCNAWLPVFVAEWVRTWDTWGDLAQHWISTASAEDLDHISKLRVPQSFIDTVLRNRLHALRYRVAWHQYHMAHAVILLRQSLPMPPREAERAKHTPSHSTPVWYTALRRRAVQPNPSDSTLRSQVHYRPPMPKKKPPGCRHPARPPDERVDWLFLQPYSESYACAMLRLISAVTPTVQDKVQRYLATRMVTTASPPPPHPHKH